MNVLGLRIAELASPWLERRGQPERIPFLDFVVDGKSLRQVFGGDVTALTVDKDPSFRTENLRRLAGDEVPLPTFEPQFHRTKVERLLHLRGVPVAFHESAFDDDRVGLYYCPCGDMDCGVLSTRLEITSSEVIWHEVGWQVTYEPFSPDQEPDVTTYRFARADYLDLFRSLLRADWTGGLPKVG